MKKSFPEITSEIATDPGLEIPAGQKIITPMGTETRTVVRQIANKSTHLVQFTLVQSRHYSV